MLSIQRLVKREFARDRVDDEDAIGRLVSARACHAVSQRSVLVVVRSDLRVE